MRRRRFVKIFVGTTLLLLCMLTWKKGIIDHTAQFILPMHIKSDLDELGSEHVVNKIVVNNRTAVVGRNEKFNEAIFINFQQEFHNTDKFGDHSSGDEVIVVQLEKNNVLFKEFIASLKQVRGIYKATLVISMNSFSEELKQLIAEIDFCRYLTLVFPYSMHFFNSSFPGQDENDCPRDIPKSQAVLNQCNNADYPDLYGHYREAEFVQMKHHWFWQLFMVFKGVRAFSSFPSPVIFLEGSHFVLPDFLHCARKVLEQRKSLCSDCIFINLGNFQVSQNYDSDNLIDVFSWTGAKSSMGLVITPDLFEIISSISDAFCEFDDYNWAWSLQYSLITKRPRKYLTLQLKSSRVFHLEACIGMKRNCKVGEEIEKIKDKFKDRTLFPDTFSVNSEPDLPPQIPRPNGGWSDVRDHILCKSYKTKF